MGQRGHSYGDDEVDNVLIGRPNAVNYLGPASDDVDAYYQMAKVVKQLSPDEYEVSERS